ASAAVLHCSPLRAIRCNDATRQRRLFQHPAQTGVLHNSTPLVFPSFSSRNTQRRCFASSTAHLSQRVRQSSFSEPRYHASSSSLKSVSHPFSLVKLRA